MRDGAGPASAGATERARTHAERLASTDGYFAPGSVIRRVSDTLLIPLLGGGPAVLLQVAHPLVATGVVEHSDFRHDLWRRLRQTLRALYLIVYGTREEAEYAGAAVQAVHARVHGATRATLGPFPAGTPYSASDPDLMLWVHATLVEVALAVHGRFGTHLDALEEAAFYDEMGVVARLFGVPDRVLPRTLPEFRDYVRAMLDGPEICVTEPAREVAAVILEAPLPLPLRVIGPAVRLACAGLLPAQLRAEYELGWSAAHELALSLAGRSLRVVSTPLFLAADRLSPVPAASAA